METDTVDNHSFATIGRALLERLPAATSAQLGQLREIENAVAARRREIKRACAPSVRAARLPGQASRAAEDRGRGAERGVARRPHGHTREQRQRTARVSDPSRGAPPAAAASPPPRSPAAEASPAPPTPGPTRELPHGTVVTIAGAPTSSTHAGGDDDEAAAAAAAAAAAPPDDRFFQGLSRECDCVEGADGALLIADRHNNAILRLGTLSRHDGGGGGGGGGDADPDGFGGDALGGALARARAHAALGPTVLAGRPPLEGFADGAGAAARFDPPPEPPTGVNTAVVTR